MHYELEGTGVTEEMMRGIQPISLDAEGDSHGVTVVNSYSLKSTDTPVIEYIMRRYLDTHDAMWLDELRGVL